MMKCGKPITYEFKKKPSFHHDRGTPHWLTNYVRNRFRANVPECRIIERMAGMRGLMGQWANIMGSIPRHALFDFAQQDMTATALSLQAQQAQVRKDIDRSAQDALRSSLGGGLASGLLKDLLK